mgnify:CR=1 FL=1
MSTCFNLSPAENVGGPLWKHLFAYSPDPIAITTFPEGTFLDINDSCQWLSGYEREQIIGRSAQHLGLIMPQRLRLRMMAKLRRQRVLTNQEMIYRTRTGEVKTLLVSLTLFFWGESPCVLILGKDISDRKRIETSLRVKEERFRAIFEQLEMGVYQASLEGKIQAANLGMAKLLGYSCDQLIQFSLDDITLAEDSGIDAVKHRQLLAGEISSYSVEKRYRHRQGYGVWVSLTVCLGHDVAGYPSFSLGVCQDISDRKAAELALRQSEARYALATNESSVGVWDWNLLTQEMYISPNLKRLLGYRPDEIPDTPEAWSSMLVHPEDQPGLNRSIHDHLNDRTPYFEMARRMLHRDGSLRWLLARGQVRRNEAMEPVRMAGTDTDITALKQAEAALRAGHQRTQDILESITDAFFALDRCWRFTYVNQRAEQLLGKSRKDLLEKNIWMIFPEMLGTRFSKEYRRAMYRHQSITFEACYAPLRIWYEMHIYPAQDGIAVYFQDVTERKHAYERIHCQIRREKALNRVLQAVRQSLDLTTIFTTAATEVAQILPLDRVAVTEYCPKRQSWCVLSEYCTNSHATLMVGQCIPDRDNPFSQQLKRLEMVITNSREELPDQVNRSIAETQNLPGAWLLVPLYTDDKTPWGSLSLMRDPCHGPWQDSEVKLAQTVADQLAIAIHQAQTLNQARRELEERQRVEARLKEAQRIACTGSWEVDLTSGQVSWSEEMFRICGLSAQATPPSLLEQRGQVHPEDRERWWASLSQMEADGQAHGIEYRLLFPDGALRYVQMFAQGHRCSTTQQVVRLVGTLTDISERKKFEQRLVYEALHDPLTGAPNRTCFMQQLSAAVERAKVELEYTFGILFIDLDRFKVINDSLGHMAGDQLLIDCTQRLQSTLRKDDWVARLGGDEFAILLSNIESPETALDVARRVHRVLQAPFFLGGREIFISASIGIASNLTGSVEAVDFLRDADTAMYRAKHQGRGQSALFAPTMHDEINTQFTLESDLQRALKRQELYLVYQPVIDIVHGQLLGFEALMRWHHPRWGNIPPTSFIPLAEETGLIMSLGNWALQAACQQLQRWQQQCAGVSELTMSVNLSAKQFANPDLIQQIDSILERTGTDSRHLRLEITESALIENPESAQTILDALRDRGIELCIDDFGTGYSSLSMIHRFPVEVLKIDRAFVNRIDEDVRGVGMVQAVLAIAQTLNMDAIAEGVETEKQLHRLRELGCQCAQGYYFAKPLAAEAATTLIEATPCWSTAAKKD